ncbi:MAG: P-loop NTPase [Candidatus Methanofastidiosa archaeon]|nr:P-loop NTPase [Candidatus Methanofastidiosa archaeon]
MLRIAVVSGKGGVGKTTVAANLAAAIAPCTLYDCDVEEPNAHHYLPFDSQACASATVLRPVVDEDRCTHCGACSAFCRHRALAVLPSSVLLFAHNCVSCGGCAMVCPEAAIAEVPVPIGTLRHGTSGSVTLVQGSLSVGEARAPPLIKVVKQEDGPGPALLDAPPGSSCPAVETLKGCDYAILVTEPTSFAFHDLTAIADVVSESGIPHGVLINRDGAPCPELHAFLSRRGIPLLGSLPMSRDIARIGSEGGLLVRSDPAVWVPFFASIYETVRRQVGK